MDLDDVLFSKEEDEHRAREEDQKIVKKNLDLSKTIALLKMKMIKSDTLISQYNDKIKECDLLSEELSAIRAEKQDVLNKYNVMMEKVTRMELTSINDKQSIEKFRRLSEAQKLKLDENEKLLSQYNFKIKSLDNEKSLLEDNVKTLQENIKALKVRSNEKKQTKHKSCQTLRIEKRDFSENTDFKPIGPKMQDCAVNTTFTAPEKRDCSVNTDFTLLESKKPIMQDQIIMTNEMLRTEPFPIFCTTCEKLVNPAPIDQILKIMSLIPPLLSEQISPPNSPSTGPKQKVIKSQESFEISSGMHDDESTINAPLCDHKPQHLCKPLINVPQEIDNSSFMELMKRVGKLEKLVNKKKLKTKKNSHTDNNSENQCCSSKNINLVVKVPRERDFHDFRKREKRKSKKIKRLKHKPFKIGTHKCADNNKWIVEHCSEATEKATTTKLIQTKEINFKKRNGVKRKMKMDSLFKSPEHVIPVEKIVNANSSPLTPECISPSQKSLLSSANSLSDINNAEKSGIKKKLFVENINIEKSVVESDIDISLSCSSLSSHMSVNEKVQISNRTAEIESDEKSRHRLLPNILSKKRVNSKEDTYAQEDTVNKSIEKEKDESNYSANKNINDREVNKQKKTLVSSPKSEENNLFGVPKYTKLIQQDDEGADSNCQKIINVDAPVQQSTCESPIDLNILTESATLKTLNTSCEFADKDKQTENTYLQETEKDSVEETFTDKQVIKQISEHSSLNINEIKIDKDKNILSKNGSFSNKSLTMEFVSPEINISTEDLSLSNESVNTTDECDKSSDSINSKESVSISSLNEMGCYQSIIQEKTVTVGKSIECEANEQEDLLTSFTETSDDNDSDNTLSESTTISNRIGPVDNKPLTKMKVDVETKKTNEACSLLVESHVPNLKTTVSQTCSFNEDNISNEVDHYKNSHNLPIMSNRTINRNMNIDATEKYKENKLISSKQILSDQANKIEHLSPIRNGIQQESVEPENEHNDSSCESTDTNYFAPSGIKRDKVGKTRKIISSDDSSDEARLNSFSTTCKFTRNNNEKSSLTITTNKSRILNLREACDDSLPKVIPSLTNLQIVKKDSLNENSSSECDTTTENERSPSFVPPKKRRIAHTPKCIESNSSCNESNQESPKIIKKIKLTKNANALPGDKITEILEVFDKTCKDRQQTIRNLNPPKPPVVSFRTLLDNADLTPNWVQGHSKSFEETSMQPPVKKPRGRPAKKVTKKLDNINGNSEKLVNVSPIPVAEQMKIPKKYHSLQLVRCTRSAKATPNKLSNANENSEKLANLEESPLSPESTVEEGEVLDIPSSLDPSNVPVTDGKLNNTLITLNGSSDIEETADGQDEAELSKPKIRAENKRVLKSNEGGKGPIRELRSRHAVVSQKSTNASQTVTLKTDLSHAETFIEINETNSCLPESAIRSCLNQFLGARKCNNKTSYAVIKKRQILCCKQFDMLINSEEWTSQLNSEVVDKLLNITQDLKMIAFFLVEYVVEQSSMNEVLDKSNTPPAPMMSKSEQKLITLITKINDIYTDFSSMVEEGLEFKLFRLNAIPKSVQTVERLFRILVVLNKIKKDREKVRMLFCDALYCLRIRAIDIIYVALKCWSEVFPKHGSNNDIIVKTIVHIVMTLQVQEPYPKLNSLRMMLSTYYEYPNSGYMTTDFRLEILKNLQENSPGIDTAVLILCKQLGYEWTTNNVINELKNMLCKNHPFSYEALCLLGNLLRSFPAEDPNKTVGENINQLCDVLDCNTVSPDVQEGIVVCLLSISKFQFEQISRSVIKWPFNQELRSLTKLKLSSFFRQKTVKWWEKFVRTNFPLAL